jgi:hypothetical protein
VSVSGCQGTQQRRNVEAIAEFVSAVVVVLQKLQQEVQTIGRRLAILSEASSAETETQDRARERLPCQPLQQSLLLWPEGEMDQVTTSGQDFPYRLHKISLQVRR